MDVQPHRTAAQEIDQGGRSLDRQSRKAPIHQHDADHCHDHSAGNLDERDHITPLVRHQKHTVLAQIKIIHNAIDRQHQDHNADKRYVLYLVLNDGRVDQDQQRHQSGKDHAGAEIKVPGGRDHTADGLSVFLRDAAVQRYGAGCSNAGLHQRHIADELPNGGNQTVDRRAVQSDKKARQQNAGDGQNQLEQQTHGGVFQRQFCSHKLNP